MKYIKKFENNKNRITYSIYIGDLTADDISIICKKIKKWFDEYRFNIDITIVALTDPKYLKINLKEYNYIFLSYIYTCFGNISSSDDDDVSKIDGNIFLNSNSKDELMKNIEIYLTSNKYNL